MRTKRSGAILLAVVAVLGGLVVIMGGLAANQRIAFQAQMNRMQMRRAEFAAQTGVNRALAALQTIDPNQVSQEDEWYELGETGSTNFILGDASFRMQILDAGALISINTANQQQLEHLPLSTEQIESLLDWRETGTDPRTEGAKDEYYNGLPTPYNARLGPFKTVDELLLVRGWDAPTLYEYDPQRTAITQNVAYDERQIPLAQFLTVDSQAPSTNAQGQPKAQIRTVTNAQLLQRGINEIAAGNIFQRRTTFTSMAQVLAVQGVNAQSAQALLDNYTINAGPTTGRINLNTASEAVLQSIEGITPDISAEIVSRQTTGFTSIGELRTIPGVNIGLLRTTADTFAVGSTTFHVRVIGTAGQTSVPLEAVVRIENGVPRILRVQRPPFSDMRERWEWDEETTTETVLSEGEV